MSDNRAPAKLTRVDKAAILLLSLGETDAAQVLRHLGPKEVQRVGVAMAGTLTAQPARSSRKNTARRAGSRFIRRRADRS